MKFKDWFPSVAAVVLASVLIYVISFMPSSKPEPVRLQSVYTVRAADETLLVNQPPKTVDVFGITYRVEAVTEIPGVGDKIYGYTDCKIHVITIRSNFGDPRLTLFHEVSHAMNCYTDRVGSGADDMQYNSSDESKHEGIYTFTGSWRETFKRNPGLAEYIGGRD